MNRVWIVPFLERFTSKKAVSKDLKDKVILALIEKKTGLKLTKIIILDTEKIWGLMAGWPMKPYMIISKDAYKGFSKDEMQWLLLHEGGHYVLWHSGKMILLHVIFLITGYLVLTKLGGNMSLGLFLGILFAVIYTQIARRFEYEANYFALSRMDNPKGLDKLYEKAKQRYGKKGMTENSFWRKLFKVWNLDIYKDLLDKSKIYVN